MVDQWKVLKKSRAWHQNVFLIDSYSYTFYLKVFNGINEYLSQFKNNVHKKHRLHSLVTQIPHCFTPAVCCRKIFRYESHSNHIINKYSDLALSRCLSYAQRKISMINFETSPGRQSGIKKSLVSGRGIVDKIGTIGGDVQILAIILFAFQYSTCRWHDWSSCGTKPYKRCWALLLALSNPALPTS